MRCIQLEEADALAVRVSLPVALLCDQLLIRCQSVHAKGLGYGFEIGGIGMRGARVIGGCDVLDGLGAGGRQAVGEVELASYFGGVELSQLT